MKLLLRLSAALVGAFWTVGAIAALSFVQPTIQPVPVQAGGGGYCGMTTDPPQGPVQCPPMHAPDTACRNACNELYSANMAPLLAMACQEEAEILADFETELTTAGIELQGCLDAGTHQGICYQRYNLAVDAAIIRRNNSLFAMSETYDPIIEAITSAYWDCAMDCCVPIERVKKND